jgi:hypothetical protein
VGEGVGVEELALLVKAINIEYDRGWGDGGGYRRGTHLKM